MLITVFLEGRITVFVPTFSLNSHFGPYFLFLPFLVPKLKNRSILVPTIISLNENILRDKRSALLAH